MLVAPGQLPHEDGTDDRDDICDSDDSTPAIFDLPSGVRHHPAPNRGNNPGRNTEKGSDQGGVAQPRNNNTGEGYEATWRKIRTCGLEED